MTTWQMTIAHIPTRNAAAPPLVHAVAPESCPALAVPRPPHVLALEGCPPLEHPAGQVPWYHPPPGPPAVPPAPPAAPPARRMLGAFAGYTYEQAIAQGWNDAALIANGYMAA